MGGVIDTCEFDVKHSNLDGRTEHDVRVYSETLMKSAIRTASILLNSTDLTLDSEQFNNLMFNWILIGSLADFQEDLDAGLLHFPLTNQQRALLDDTNEFEERKELIRDVLITEEDFKDIKNGAIGQVLINSLAFLDTELPLWQKILSTAYSYQVIFKYALTKYPEFEK